MVQFPALMELTISWRKVIGELGGKSLTLPPKRSDMVQARKTHNVISGGGFGSRGITGPGD